MRSQATAPHEVTLARLVAPVYLPMVIGTIGVGVLIPVLPLYLTDSGLSLGLASVVLASVGLGATIGGLPVGTLVSRLGDRAVLFVSLVMIAASTAALGLTTTAIALVALRLTTGVSNIGLRLACQTYVTRHVGIGRRGRSMAMIGGSFRFSALLGPLLGGWLVDTTGYTTTFAVAGGLTLIGLLPALMAGPEPPTITSPQRQFGAIKAIRTHWRVVLVGGLVPLLVMAVREGRFVVLPLIGDDIGLSPTVVGAVVSVGTAADLVLFPVAGWIMDRFGRLSAMVPGFGLVAVGLVLLGLANSTTTIVLAGTVIGIGNGLSSGSMLTLGSDLAPDDSTAPFLAAMAAMGNAGRMVGPLLVGVVGAVAGLGGASFALAGVLVAAIVWLVVVIGETRTP